LQLKKFNVFRIEITPKNESKRQKSMAKNSEKSILKYFKNQVLTEEKKCNFGSKKVYVFQPLK